MAFMQRYTQAREAIARIEEMQSQARYREAQAQVQAVEMARKAKEDQRKAQLQADIANLQAVPQNTGGMPQLSTGYLRKNPHAMEELKGLQATLAQNSALAHALKKNGDEKYIEVEGKNGAIRTRMTAIGDAAAKFEEDQKKEIAQAGMAMANAPDEPMFHAAWTGLSPEVQAHFKQRGLPIGEDGMPMMVPGVQSALKTIATTSLTTAEQATLQRDAAARANTARDNERADEGSARAKELHPLQVQAAKQNLLNMKREESGKLTPWQEIQRKKDVFEQAQQDNKRTETAHAAFVNKLKLPDYQKTQSYVEGVLKPLVRKNAAGQEYIPQKLLDVIDQHTIKEEAVKMLQHYKSRAGSSQLQDKGIRDLSSYGGKVDAYFSSIGHGRASMTGEVAMGLLEIMKKMHGIVNEQAVEHGLIEMDKLKKRIPAEAQDAYGADTFANSIQGDVGMFMQTVRTSVNKKGQPRFVQIKGDDGRTRNVVETISGKIIEVPDEWL